MPRFRNWVPWTTNHHCTHALDLPDPAIDALPESYRTWSTDVLERHLVTWRSRLRACHTQPHQYQSATKPVCQSAVLALLAEILSRPDDAARPWRKVAELAALRVRRRLSAAPWPDWPCDRFSKNVTLELRRDHHLIHGSVPCWRVVPHLPRVIDYDALEEPVPEVQVCEWSDGPPETFELCRWAASSGASNIPPARWAQYLHLWTPHQLQDSAFDVSFGEEIFVPPISAWMPQSAGRLDLRKSPSVTLTSAPATHQRAAAEDKITSRGLYRERCPTLDSGITLTSVQSNAGSDGDGDGNGVGVGVGIKLPGPDGATFQQPALFYTANDDVF